MVPSWMLWKFLMFCSSTSLTSSTKFVIKGKKDIKFIWQCLFSVNPCWWAWIIFSLLTAPLFYLGSMVVWQAYNYLGCLLYPLKILAQHKLSVSLVEIPCCSTSYGKLTFIIQKAVTKEAQGRTRLSTLTLCHLPYSEGVPQFLWYYYTWSGNLDLLFFHKCEFPFPPSTAT